MATFSVRGGTLTYHGPHLGLLPVTPVVSGGPGRWVLPADYAVYVQLASVDPQLVPADLDTANWLTAITADVDLEVEPVGGITPYSYQSRAVEMFCRYRRLWLWDDMGTGKTFSSLFAVRANGHERTLVVAPKSTLKQWMRDAERILEDTATIATSSAFVMSNIIVMTYNRLAASIDEILRWKPTTVIYDEQHLLKNKNSARSKAALKLAKRLRPNTIMLSGTPVANNLGDLFSPMRIMSPNVFPSEERFRARFFVQEEQRYGPPKIVGFSYDGEREFYETTRGYTRRISLKEAAPELPEVRYSARYVDLPPTLRRAYNSIREQMIAEYKDSVIVTPTVLQQLNLLTRLAAAEVEPIINHQGDDVTTHYDYETTGHKYPILKEILDEATGQVLVFGQSKQLVCNYIEELRADGYSVAGLHGGLSANARGEEIERFQQGKARVMVATLGAGGTGINLTAATTVIFISRSWSLTDNMQAEARAHRIGQTKPVHIIDIVANDTVDEQIVVALRDKQDLLQAVTGGHEIKLEDII